MSEKPGLTTSMPLPPIIFTPQQTDAFFVVTLRALEAESQRRLTVMEGEYQDKRVCLGEESRIRKECMQRESAAKEKAILSKIENAQNVAQQEMNNISDLKRDELKTRKLMRQWLENEGCHKVGQTLPNGKWMEDSL